MFRECWKCWKTSEIVYNYLNLSETIRISITFPKIIWNCLKYSEIVKNFRNSRKSPEIFGNGQKTSRNVRNI